MPKRTISTLAALGWADLTYETLDVGTGTGAAPLALSVLGTAAQGIQAIDPSHEMLRFARQLPLRSARVRFDRGAIGAELPPGVRRRFDLVLVSAALPFSFAD